MPWPCKSDRNSGPQPTSVDVRLVLGTGGRVRVLLGGGLVQARGRARIVLARAERELREGEREKERNK